MKKTDSQLPAVLATHQPKPTAAQVRRATAQALADDYAAETKRLDEQIAELEKAISDAAIRHVRKQVRTLPYDTSAYGDEVTIKFEFKADCTATPEPLRQLLTQLQELSHTCQYRLRKTAKDFEAELRAAAAGLANPIEATLLADPVIKQALIEAGKKALSLPTATDKATAIAV